METFSAQSITTKISPSAGVLTKERKYAALQIEPFLVDTDLTFQYDTNPNPT